MRMTKHYFPLLSVNLLSDKPVLHPEKNLETSVSAGWGGGRALGRAPLAQQTRL